MLTCTIWMGLPIIYLRGHRSEFLKCDAFLSLKIVLTPANSEGTDEMPRVLPGSLLFAKVPIYGFQDYKGLTVHNIYKRPRTVSYSICPF